MVIYIEERSEMTTVYPHRSPLEGLKIFDGGGGEKEGNFLIAPSTYFEDAKEVLRQIPVRLDIA